MEDSSSNRRSERDLFLEADSIDDPHAREAFLREQCGEDEAMLGRLRELLDLAGDEEDLIDLDPAQFFALESAREDLSQRLASRARSSSASAVRSAISATTSWWKKSAAGPWESFSGRRRPA